MSSLPVGEDDETQAAFRQIARGLHQEQFELLEEILRRQKAEATKRRLALLIGGAGALFAAIRLGIIFAPKVRRRRQLGKLGE